MQVSVIGMGYIGFPTACLVADAGHRVTGVDVNAGLIAGLQKGRLHIVNEKGLQDVADRVLKSGMLQVSQTPAAADVFIIAVPTPFSGEHGEAGHAEAAVASELPPVESSPSLKADLKYVQSAVESILPYLSTGAMIILESTVPPGTTERVLLPLVERAGYSADTVHLVHAPERVLPGNIVHELIHNDRLVGGLTPAATQKGRDFYRSFVKGNVITTDATTAELAKLMENTYRDVNIAIANEFALVSEQLGTNVWEAINLANCHPRVNILKPGPGVGGHCIAVDPYFIVAAAPDVTPLIQTARRVNSAMPYRVALAVDKLARQYHIKKIAALGASYKADVGDDRESPSLTVASLLQGKGYDVVIQDNYIPRYHIPLAEALTGADLLLLLTNHSYLRHLQPADVLPKVNRPLVYDTHGCLDTRAWTQAGFTVKTLGVGNDTC